MPKKLTFAEAEKLLRRKPEWRGMTKAEQRDLVAAYNADLAEKAKAAAYIRRQLNAGKRRK